MSVPTSYASNAISVVFTLLTLGVSQKINSVVTTPYMDEIFHIPQAKAFCSASLRQLISPLLPTSFSSNETSIHYDPKLTTPPGLYLLSNFLSKCAPRSWTKSLGFQLNCNDLAALRATNVLLILLLPFIVAAIINTNLDQDEKRRIVQHLRIANASNDAAHIPTGTLLHLPPSYTQSTPSAQNLPSPRTVFQHSSTRSSSAASNSIASTKAKHLAGGIPRSTVRMMQERAAKQDAKTGAVSESNVADGPSSEPNIAPLSPPGSSEPRQDNDLQTPPSSSPTSDDVADILTTPQVVHKLRRRTKSAHTTLLAHTICFLPPFYFFGFLYYTDVGSTFCILVCLLATKKQWFFVSAVAAAASLWFRQTNVVWLLFVATDKILYDLQIELADWIYDPVLEEDQVSTGTEQVAVAVGNRNDSSSRSEQPHLANNASPPVHDDRFFLIDLFKSIRSILMLIFWPLPTPSSSSASSSSLAAPARRKFFKILTRNLVPLLPSLVGFAYFIIVWNDGAIVLGDKANHQAAKHFPQVFYFLVFATAFGFAPMLGAFAVSRQPSRQQQQQQRRRVQKQKQEQEHGGDSDTADTGGDSYLRIFTKSISGMVRETFDSMYGTFPRTLLSSLVGTLILHLIQNYTIHHPFLLSDNRHYTFYLWKRMRRFPATLQLLTPVYLTLGYIWMGVLWRHKSVLWITAFLACTSVTLVSSPLIEPRYFITPYLLLRIHIWSATSPSPLSTALQKQDRRDPKTTHESSRKVSDPKSASASASASAWFFLILELVWYTVVNLITVYIFLYKPFSWPSNGVDIERNESTTMRFMW